MRILLAVLLLSCGGQEPEPLIDECRATFCADSPYRVSIVNHAMDLPVSGHIDHVCVCWCPSPAESNRYMEFFTSIPPPASIAPFFAQQWREFCPQ